VNRIPAGLLAVVLLLGGACAKTDTPTFNGRVVESPAPSPDLSGVNWNGAPFSLSDLRGRAAVVFFGYTYCPDVCPMTLAKMKQLYAALGERADDMAVVFVSVDPDRDSVEKLAQYVPNFDERFYGLHLDDEQLQTLQDSLGLTIQYGQPKDGPGTDSYYYVDHTGTYFLFDRQGILRLEFPPNATVPQMLPDVERLLATSGAGMVISEARISALPNGNGALYLTVDNQSDSADRLTTVSTTAAAVAEIHETSLEDGVMRMRPRPEGVSVPVGTPLRLEPGGIHVMLLQLTESAQGAEVPVILEFEQAGPIAVSAQLLLLHQEDQ